MIDITPRKQLGLIDYNNIPTDCAYIGRLPSPFSNVADGCERIVDFFVANGLVINRRERRINGVANSAINQFEMPLAGVKWMIEAIEQGFEKPHSAGGLAKNKLNMDTCIDEEELRVEYGVWVGREGVGGYTVVNFDRSCYVK